MDLSGNWNRLKWSWGTVSAKARSRAPRKTKSTDRAENDDRRIRVKRTKAGRARSRKPVWREVWTELGVAIGWATWKIETWWLWSAERNKGSLVNSRPAMAFTSSELPQGPNTGNRTTDKKENITNWSCSGQHTLGSWSSRTSSSSSCLWSGTSSYCHPCCWNRFSCCSQTCWMSRASSSWGSRRWSGWCRRTRSRSWLTSTSPCGTCVMHRTFLPVGRSCRRGCSHTVHQKLQQELTKQTPKKMR
jgi:hypothetical protein